MGCSVIFLVVWLHKEEKDSFEIVKLVFVQCFGTEQPIVITRTTVIGLEELFIPFSHVIIHRSHLSDFSFNPSYSPFPCLLAFYHFKLCFLFAKMFLCAVTAVDAR